MNTQIYDEAGEWVVRHRTAALDERSKRQFDGWLRESPQHVRAYLEISSVWEGLSDVAPAAEVSAQELIARARADDNVYALDSAVTGRAKNATRARLWAIAATFLLTVGGFAGWFYSRHNLYDTTIGEQRTIALSDGSSIELNARSRIKIRYSQRERTIELLRGQALFKVAKDANRPFVVDSEGARVRAVGTQFDVYRKSSGTIVTVIEGRVAVSSTELGPGEQVIITPEAIIPSVRTNVEAATAWTQQRLVFEVAPLADVAEEFNRYNRRRLVIDDPRLQEFNISGVFSSTDPTLLLRFLRAQPGIAVDEADEEIRISRP